MPKLLTLVLEMCTRGTTGGNYGTIFGLDTTYDGLGTTGEGRGLWYK